jgi:hypothetical protein
MRCPKCSYISFDHYDTCQKCGRNLAELASQMHGTVQKTSAPLFLGSALEAFSGGDTAAGFNIAGKENELTLADDAAEGSGPGDDEGGLQLQSDQPEEVFLEEEFQSDDEFDFHLEPGAEGESAEEAGESPAGKENETPSEAAPDSDADELPAPNKVSLDFEGLDLSDLSPEETAVSEEADVEETESKTAEKKAASEDADAEQTGKNTGDEPFDLWAMNDTDNDTDTTEIFKDLKGEVSMEVRERADAQDDDDK